jgi:hypothetical protein
MIAPLRAAHRRMIATLAVAIPAVFVAGLAYRRPVSPLEVSAANSEPAPLIRELASERGLITARLHQAPNRDQLILRVEPRREAVSPDLLVYWSPQRVDSALVPADARLLGSLYDSRFLLSNELGSRGYLVLYSVAHNSPIDSVAFGVQP